MATDRLKAAGRADSAAGRLGRGRGPGRPGVSWAQAAPWVLRVLWVSLVFTAGPVLVDAVASASTPVRIVATAGLWTGWTAGTIAVAVPHTLALTAIRLLGPSAAACVVAAAVGGHPSVLGIGWALAILAIVNSAAIGTRWANGMAYPNETRFLLRIPAPLLAGPLVLAWALVAASVTSGPLLLAAQAWVGGALAVAVGAPVVWVLLRALHNLSQRWIVFVPAGIVLHDPMTLDVPILFPRQQVAAFAAAIDRGVGGDDVLDLTQRAAGVALDIELNEEATLTLLSPGRREGRSATTALLRIAPTRPGAVLEEARRRRVG